MYDDEVISRKKPMKRSQMKTQTRKQIEEALYAEVEDIAQDIDNDTPPDDLDYILHDYDIDHGSYYDPDGYDVGHGSHFYLVEPSDA